MTTVLTKKEIEMIKERIEDRVAGWVQTYADTITKNYREYHIQTLKNQLKVLLMIYFMTWPKNMHMLN